MTPPRARGSTSESCLRSYNAGDSPAYAGIDRRKATAYNRGSGLPRVRGDRPMPTQWKRCCERTPPRMRGSTLMSTRTELELADSPACAGMLG